jgi:hypothetical protein
MDPFQRFVDQMWNVLAALAWQGYTCHGRGVVVVRLHLCEEAPIGTSDVDYYSAATIREGQYAWAPSELAKMIERYNAEAEVVVLFLNEETGDHLALLADATDRLSPPDALRLRREELDRVRRRAQ